MLACYHCQQLAPDSAPLRHLLHDFQLGGKCSRQFQLERHLDASSSQSELLEGEAAPNDASKKCEGWPSVKTVT